jgi:NAD(P)-dependent dehydrogenase (short-subunit alcohol dehydrogenase family)
MIALVTGSSRGIGKAITELLLDNRHSVLGTSKSTNFETSNTNYSHIFCDLSKSEELLKLKSLFDTENPPDVLINNAGMFRDADFSISDDEWLDTWDVTQQVNLRSAALLSKWAINAWTDKDMEGRIINISSRAGMRGDTGEYAAYAASKAGMIGLTCRAKFSWFYLLNLVRVGMSCYATPELSPARWRR